MRRFALPAALAATLWTTAFAAALAQDKADPAKPANSAQTAPAKPVAPAKPSDPNVVGSVNGKNILFADVVARLRTDSPAGFTQSVAQAVGAKAADQLFGDKPQDTASITKDEALNELRDHPNQVVFTTLQTILREEAINQESAKQNVNVTDEQVNAFINRTLMNVRKQRNIPKEVTDDQFLAQNKISRPVLMQRLRPQLQLSALLQKDLEKNLGHPLGPDDYVQARHVLVLVSKDASSNPADAKKADDAALAKIKKVATELQSGKKTFEVEAKEVSEDPGSRDNGGDLGPFVRGMMVKEFDKAAFESKPNQVVGPIKTSYGYHLIKVEKLGKDLTPDQRQAALEQYTTNSNRFQAFVQELMGKRVQVAVYMTPPPQPAQPGFGGPTGQ